MAYNLRRLRNVPSGFVYAEAWDRRRHRPGWAARFGFGIVKYVRLARYPAVHLTDIFVRPSVRNRSLSVSLAVRNAGRTAAVVRIAATLSAWGPSRSAGAVVYPAVPAKDGVTALPGTDTKVELGTVAWALGESSYWRPSRPFREDYAAVLHWLNLTVSHGEGGAHRCATYCPACVGRGAGTQGEGVTGTREVAKRQGTQGPQRKISAHTTDLKRGETKPGKMDEDG